MKYTAKYKLSNQWFWRTIKNVEGDDIMPNGCRCLFLDNKERIEIPNTAIVKFSKERFQAVKEKMEQEAGQSIPTK